MPSPELSTNKSNTQNIDYLKVLKIIWSRWYWVAFCILIALTVTYIYLWYTPKIFSTTASLKFSEEKSQITDLLGVKANNRTNGVQAETYVIQSKDVLLNAISRMDYQVSYFVKGRVRTTDLYPEKPFPIEIIQQDTLGFYQGMLEVKPVNKQTYELTFQNKHKIHQYNAEVSIPGISFIIKSGPNTPESSYLIKFNTPESLLGRVAGGLTMREASKSSNVLLLNFIDRNPYFARDVLNSILKEYVYYDGYQRKISASQTIEFINEQLSFLAAQVSTSGAALENFKRDRKIVDLRSSSSNQIEKLYGKQDKKDDLALEELSINELEQQVKSNSTKDLNFNYNVEGKVDVMLSNLIAQLNQFIIDKNKLLLTYNNNAAPVKNIDQQIADTKKAIADNIRNFKERNQRVQRYVDKEISSSEQDITKLPGAERNYLKLESDFEINQKVFYYLFEKKLEAQISKAAVVAGASVVDFATESGALVAPIPNRAYTYSFIWGIGIGIGIILLVRLTNPYIYDKETVEYLTTIPIIGIIRKFPGFIDKDNTQVLSLEKPKSIFAESVRSVRTNLSFLAGEKKCKVICITSEIAGEGKSFVAINLASTLALIEKKVVLVGADLRKSKLHRTFHTDNKKGLSTYLSKQDEFSNIILHTENPNLDFIPSGATPPNPSELLHTQRMKELIAELSEIYDFVLIDTAPVGLVSDSIPLIRQSDINLFVLRAGVSRYNAATIPNRIAGEYDLNNVVIVLNAFTDDVFHSRFYSNSYSGGAYQYYYSDYSGYAGDGYFTEDEKPKWWTLKRWFKNS